MKFIYKAALLICSSVFAMSVQAAGMPQSSKHAQRGVNCTQCHTTGKFEPVEQNSVRPAITRISWPKKPTASTTFHA